MGKKYFLLQFSLFLLALFFINLFIRKSIPASYSAILDYNQLYFDRDRIHIEDFSLSGDSLDILLSGGELKEGKNNFQVFSGSRLIARIESPDKEIRFRLDSAGVNRISIAVNGSSQRLPMNIDFSPDSMFRKFDNRSSNEYELLSDIPVRAGTLYAAKEWAVPIPESNSIAIEEQTSSILEDSIQLKTGESSVQKILKIARFILKRTAGKEGIPADELSRLHPLKQLEYIEAGKSKLWCGNFSAIFSYLASSAGIQVRLVSCGLSNGGVSTGIHVFCEAYLKEDQSWAYVDLTSRNILVSYNKSWLNAIDIQRLLRYQVQDSSLVAWHYEKDSLYQVPFYKVENLNKYYFHANAVFTFYFGDYLAIQNPANIFSRAIKFFYTKPYYALYSDNLPIGNSSFFLRILTNYLLAAAFLIWLLILIRRIIQK
jgi:hypothetical protein